MQTTKVQTTKVQYIKTKLQVETAKKLLNNALDKKRNEKAKLLFQQDLKKLQTLQKKWKPAMLSALNKLGKLEGDFAKEVKKATANKCIQFREVVDDSAKEYTGCVAVNNNRYSSDLIDTKEIDEIDIRIYKEKVNLDKEQKEVDDFILDMILGKVTADELNKLVAKISKIK